MNNIKILGLSVVSLACLLLLPTNSGAASTDLSNSPLVTASPISVSPNVMLMMDDSGSMDWDFMPDNAGNAYFGTGKYGYQSNQCNGVFYNPAITYTPPVKADGTSYPNATFTAAWLDGFQSTTASTVDLSTKFNVGLFQSTTTASLSGFPAYYYLYTGSQKATAQKNYFSTTSTFYQECNSSAPTTPGSTGGSTPGSTVFTYVKVSTTSGPGGIDERQNFANWFSYYRTRVNMMKTGSGLAFKGIGSNYRVGFATMNNNKGSDFVNPASFDSAGKTNWYSKLYGVATGNSTPLLKALSNVGLLYANKLPGNALNGVAANDPIQYSCQQNFAILSTDGYWNVQTNQTLTAGPSTTAVGNTDAGEVRPMYDGASSLLSRSTSQVQETDTQILKSTDQLQKTTSQVQVSTSQVQVSTSQVQVSTSQVRVSTSQVQKSTSQIQVSTSQIQKSTSQLQVSTSQIQVSTSQIQVSTQTTTCPKNKSCTTVTTGPTNASSCTSGTSTTTAKNGTTTTVTTTCSTAKTGPTNASSCTPSNVNGLTTTCSTVTTGPTNASSCTPGTSNGLTTTCSTVNTGPTNASSCSAGTSNGLTTTCSKVTTGPTNASSCSAGTSSGLTTTCSTVTTGPTNASSCTPGTSNGLTTTCSTVNTGPTNTSSCTPSNVNGLTTTCSTATTGPTNASSCTPSNVNGLTTTCSTATTGPTNVSSCTAGTSNGLTTTCSAATTGPTNASSCTPSNVNGLTTTCSTAAAGPSNATSCTTGIVGGLTTVCSFTPITSLTPAASCTAGTTNGVKTTCQTNTTFGPSPVASCTPAAPTSTNNFVTTACNTVTTGPTTVTSCTAQPASATNNFMATTCNTTFIGGTSDTLADVAEYYYVTDLRDTSLSNCTGAVTGVDVCANNVPTVKQDSASWQHMTTFTLGLGAPGRMIFSPSYLTDTSGDFFSVAQGLTASPAVTGPPAIPAICSWQSSGACNWPTPNPAGTPENIDDLWHAAVDGRGSYFSAANPSALQAGLFTALNGVQKVLGASAAATTSNPNVTAGDNFVFSSTFVTQDWTGQLIRQQLDINTGDLPIFDPNDPTTFDWAAQGLLDARAFSSRTLYTLNASATPPAIQAFNATNFASSSLFNTPNISLLSQFCSTGSTCLSASAKTAAAGTNLVNYLMGDRSHEGIVDPVNSPNAYYRPRPHILGDIVNSETVYVKGTLFKYNDPGFSQYATNLACRQPMVYVGGNDGMLHAFYATSGLISPCTATSVTAGGEAWGYIPTPMLKNLYKLADENYTNNHTFFVDGTPVVSDICTSNCTNAATAVWKTILVGGYNAGERGYFALDVTDPASPKVLWEFTDANLGFSYGNPVVTKLNDGTWVVLLSSGYNNVSPGDGQGRLYVLNAVTGAIIRQISTGVGSTATPIGLARINAFVNDASTDNTALRAYGGDLAGNLWRFDLNASTGTYDAQLLVTLLDASSNPQPITAKPELASINGVTVVYVGTGKFLGTSDLTTTQTQSFYAIKDTLATPGTSISIWPNPRSKTCTASVTTNCFVKQTLSSNKCPTGVPICSSGQNVLNGTNLPVDFTNQNGWFFDLTKNGERANSDPQLLLGILAFNTNSPSVSSCTQGGTSNIYVLNYLTGGPFNGLSTGTGTVASVELGNAFVSRPVLSLLPNNKVTAVSRLSNGITVTTKIPVSNLSTGSMRRISWHELISE